MLKNRINRVIKSNYAKILPDLTELINDEIVKTFEKRYQNSDEELNILNVTREQGYLKGLKFVLNSLETIVERQRKEDDDE